MIEFTYMRNRLNRYLCSVVIATIFAGLPLTAAGAKPAEIQDEYNVLSIFPTAVEFQYDRWTSIKGADIVKEVYFSSKDKQARVKYLNDTEQRIKPDVIIWVLNKDGVVLNKFADSWILKTMSPGEKCERRWKYSLKPNIDISDELAFSRWARSIWDAKPGYIMAVGSKYAYDKLIEKTKKEIKKCTQGLPPLR